jgi:hypothetical protein
VYLVNNVGAALVTHNTPDATNPRIDQVYTKIYDSTDGGDLSDQVAAIVVTGVPTGGATLDNRTGAGAVPANALLLADVLVPAAAGSAASFTYRDRRQYAVRGVVPNARGSITTEQVMLEAAPPLTTNQAFNGSASSQRACLCFLSRRIVGATVMRWEYTQGSGTAITGNYSLAIFDSSGRLIVQTAATSFVGIINSQQNRNETIAATTLEAGLYYVGMGYQGTNVGTMSFLAVGPLATGQVCAHPNACLVSGSGGTTFPNTLLAYTETRGVNPTDSLSVPLISLATA